MSDRFKRVSTTAKWLGLWSTLVLAAGAFAGERPAAAPLAAEQPNAAYLAPLSLDPDAYYQFVDAATVLLTDFALPGGGTVDLALAPIDVFSPDALIVTGTARGDVPMADPQVLLLSGHIVGQSNSRAFLGISPNAVHGLIRTAKDTYVVSSGPPGEGYQPVIYNLGQTPEGALQVDPFVCHIDELATPYLREAGLGGGGVMRVEPCRIADLAIETDWEFRQIFGNEPDAAAYAATLIGAISEIYVNDMNLHLRISYLRIWNTSSDPWTQGSTVDQLFEFADYWNLNMTGLQRHVAHFLSGRGLGGGVAWGDAACFPDFNYAVSANLAGFFPYPLQSNHVDNWDVMVVAHELGHNFGAPHTHDIGIDNCAGGDCSVTPNGTIMSYCHLCPGGMTNIVLVFHPTMLSAEIYPFLNSGQCSFDNTPPAISSDPADQAVCQGAGVSFSVAASGAGTLSYQWRKDGGAIAGANSATYAIASTTAGDAGSYDCVVSNECNSSTSAAAALTICTGNVADVTGDCLVNLNDLAVVLANFGISGANHSDGDVNGDTVVNLSDLADVLGNFGVGC